MHLPHLPHLPHTPLRYGSIVPIKQPNRYKHIYVPKSSWAETAEVTSYFVGKGIILFTMFYCSMNWWHYKRMREDIETEQKENKKKK